MSYRATGQDHVHRADSLIMDSNYNPVISMVDHNLPAITDITEKILLENVKIQALIGLGLYDKAKTSIDSLLTTIDNQHLSRRLEAVTKNNKAFLELNQGRNDLAEKDLQEATGIFEDLHQMNSLEAARTVDMLGLVYLNTGKYNQALEQMLRALDIRKDIAGMNRELLAASYNDLGLVYSQIDKNKAVDDYNQALNIYREIHGDNHPKVAIAKTNLAVIDRDLGKYNDALNNFNAALKIWETVYQGSHPNKAFVLQNIGETYAKSGAFNVAMDYFNKALSMYRDVFGKKHPEIATVLNEMGNTELSLGNYDKALEYYQGALIANVGNFNDPEIKDNPSTSNYFNGDVLLYSLLFKAEALESQYYGKTLRFRNLKIALKTLVQCDSLIERLRQQSMNENDKIALGTLSGDVYSDGVRISDEAALNSLLRKPYRDLAFFFAEKSKGAVLQEAISDTDAKSYAGIPSDLLDHEKELKSEMATVSRKIATMAGNNNLEALRNKAFELNREYETFVKNLEKNYPEYYNLKFNTEAPTVGDVQQLLDPSSAVLSYFIDEKNKRLYIFLISHNKYRIIDHPITENFDRMITGFRNSMYYDEIMSCELTSTELYKKLIPQIPGNIKNLIIIPAGRLAIIPFEALLARNDHAAGNYSDAPFLIKKYNIRYEYSAGLMLEKSKTKISQSPSIFLCAPVNFPPSDRLASLPGTLKEVDEISGVFRQRHLTSTLYTGKAASESLLKSDTLKKYNFIHLATHGLVDEANPDLSCVYLQPDKPGDDGKLYAGEIYNLQLDANLVTLSACRTGLGKITRGEGVIGLSRALIYAGARNIIVSYWNVADVSTASLMKDFYQNQIENPNAGYSDNLRKAKLDLLNSNKYSAPYYWAPFILIGN